MKIFPMPDLKRIIAIIRKELWIYFNSPIAYVFLIFFLIISSWLFLGQFFLNGQSNMQFYFDILPWIFLFFISAITMRLLAEEKKSGTIEILLTLPVKDYEVVLGKFLASALFLAIVLLFSFPIPLLLTIVGNPDSGQIIGSYIGAYLLGICFLSIGLFVSSFTKNQIIAFVVSITIAFLLFITSTPVVIFAAPSFMEPVLNFIGLSSHYSSISRGVFDSRDLLYFVSFIGLFLYFSSRSLETRKYK